MCGVRDERGKEVKKKKARRLADQCERLSKRINRVWCEINVGRLDECRKSLDAAIFELGHAAGELLKESMRKPK